MKCSNPDCIRGIGLVAYQRGWFTSGAIVQRVAADGIVADRPRRRFEWLFLQPTATPQQKLLPVFNRIKAR
jgi:hypothetical protein